MSITFGEIEELIKGALFEQVGDPEKPEKKYREQTILKDEFTFSRGDEWVTKEGRYVFQEDKTFSTRKIKLVFIPNVPSHFLQFRQYKDKQTAELKKEIKLSNLIFKLSRCVNDYFLIQKIAEEYADSISKGLKIGIPPQAKHREKMIIEGLGMTGLNKKRKKVNLILSLYSILNEHTRNIDNEHKQMDFYYIAIILQACGIENGQLDKIQHRLYEKYRGLIN